MYFLQNFLPVLAYVHRVRHPPASRLLNRAKQLFEDLNELPGSVHRTTWDRLIRHWSANICLISLLLSCSLLVRFLLSTVDRDSVISVCTALSDGPQRDTDGVTLRWRFWGSPLGGTTKISSEAAPRNVWKVPLAIIRTSLQITLDPFPATICKVIRTSCEDYARLLKHMGTVHLGEGDLMQDGKPGCQVG